MKEFLQILALVFAALVILFVPIFMLLLVMLGFGGD
jgi:hypothetical protein